MRELKIGEEIRIRCVEDKGVPTCKRCVFIDFSGIGRCREMLCSRAFRTDHKNVHFEIVPTEIKDSLTTEELEAKAKGFADFYLIEKEYDFERHSLEFGYIKGYEASHRKQRGRTAPNRALIDTLIKRACDWLCGNCEMCGDCEWQHSNTDCPTLKSMKTFMND